MKLDCCANDSFCQKCLEHWIFELHTQKIKIATCPSCRQNVEIEKHWEILVCKLMGDTSIDTSMDNSTDNSLDNSIQSTESEEWAESSSAMDASSELEELHDAHSMELRSAVRTSTPVNENIIVISDSE